MAMGLQDKAKGSELMRLRRSFKYALEGLVYVIKNERNMQIHLAFSVLAILLGLILKISKLEFLVILLLIGFVITLETVNTAIERVVDLITNDYHPLAKVSKDLSAAAVFVATIISILIGGIIFYSPLIQLLEKMF